MLEVANLSVSYGGLRALTDVSLSVKEGQFVTVVGPNGAGKSTLFKTISGIVPRRAGPDHVHGAGSVRGFHRLGGRIWGSPTSRKDGRCSRP